MKPQRDTVLITGASSGIGEALAYVCAKHELDMILVARSVDKLEALAAELSQQYDVDITVRPCDLSGRGNVKKLCDGLIAEGRHIDMLVNNAGVLEHGSFVAMSAQDHQRMVQLNVSSLTDMLAHILPTMVERGSGRIMNVASIAAFQPVPSLATYAATKAYVLSLSEALAEELRGTGVTVTALCPGITATSMVADAQQQSESLLNMPGIVIGEVDKVAREAFRACIKGEPVVVPGAFNLAGTMASRATPKWLVRRVSGIVGRRTLPRN